MVAEAARVLLVATFGIASVAKLRDPGPLTATLSRSRLGSRAQAVTYGVAISEAVVAIALGSGVALPLAAVAASVLLGLFSIWIVAHPNSGGCGCGLPAGDLAEWQLLARNAFLALAAAAVMWRGGQADLISVALAALVATFTCGAALTTAIRDRRGRSAAAPTNRVGGLA